MNSKKQILITGGEGFIGKYLVKKLREEGYNVLTLEQFGVDITQPKDFLRIPRDFNVVFHLAAHIPYESNRFDRCMETNVLGTYNLLEFCSRVGARKIIYSSTVSVNNPDSIYGISKLIGEKLCQAYALSNKAKTVILRYSSVYGVGQNPKTVLPIFIARAKADQDLIIFSQGKKIQDFIYVKDVVEANLRVLRSNTQGIYDIGSGIGTNMTKLARTIIKVFGSRSKIIFNKNKKEDTSRNIMNIFPAKRDLKYKPQYELEKGLKDYYKMLTENYGFK